MNSDWLRVFVYVIVIIQNIRYFVINKEIYNISFAGFFIIETARRIFLEDYLTRGFGIAVNVFQLLLIIITVVLFIKSKQAEKKSKS